MEEFTNKDIAQLLDMKQSTVAFYTNQGFVKPDIADPKGRGTTRKYSKRNLVQILIVSKLVKLGMNHSLVKDMFRYIDPACDVSKECFAYQTKSGKIVQAETMGFDALNPEDPMTKDKHIFLVVYDDDKENVNFALLWEKDPRNLRLDMHLFEMAKVINITPLLEQVRRL